VGLAEGEVDIHSEWQGSVAGSDYVVEKCLLVKQMFLATLESYAD
jgi:hypothetical protein